MIRAPRRYSVYCGGEEYLAGSHGSFQDHSDTVTASLPNSRCDFYIHPDGSGSGPSGGVLLDFVRIAVLFGSSSLRVYRTLGGVEELALDAGNPQLN